MKKINRNHQNATIVDKSIKSFGIKKSFILLLFSFLFSSIYSQTYYFANSGDDSYTAEQAQNESTPWKTLDKVNSLSLSPGATILFKRGDAWRGQITVDARGNSANPITFGAYGSGNKPIISGSIPVNGWTLHEGNIYKTTVSENVVQLFLNNERKQIARYPNSGFNTIDQVNSTTSFTDNDIDKSIDWTGGQLHWRANRWRLLTKPITSFSDGTIFINKAPSYPLQAGWGYFISNKLEALDSPGEWYYDKNSNTLYFWTPSGDTPENYPIEASITNYGFRVKNTKYVTISDFNLQHQVKAGVKTEKSSHITIQNNDVYDTDEIGIHVGNSTWGYETETNNVVKNNRVDGANFYGIFFSTQHSTLLQNEVYNTGLIENFNARGIGDYYSSAIAIYMPGGNNTVRENRIDNSGYIGIFFNHAPNSLIEYNYVTNCCVTVDDGGGIYTYTQNYTDEGSEESIVRNNIVTDIIGAPQGTVRSDYYAAEGIYIDGLSHEITVEDNTVANCGARGLFMNAGRNNSFIKNTSYNNSIAQIYLREHSGGDVKGIELNQNIYYSLTANQLSLYEKSLINDDTDFGTYNNNYYCNPYSEVVIKKQSEYYTLEAWQNETGQDADSHKSIADFPKSYGPNLISNSTFDSNINHWNYWSNTGKAKNTWEVNALLDDGTLKHDPKGASNSYASHNLALEEGSNYEINFSIVSETEVSMRVDVIYNRSPWTDVGFTQKISAKTTRQDFTFIFESTATDNDIMIYFYDSKGVNFWLDNVHVRKIEISGNDDPKDLSPLFINPTMETVEIDLEDHKYLDLDGNKVSGIISLKPFTSQILTVLSDTTTTIKEHANNYIIKIFPNPVSESFIVSTDKNQHYFIYNSLGNKIGEGELFMGDNTINISHYNRGIYFIKTEKGNIGKILKK